MGWEASEDKFSTHTHTHTHTQTNEQKNFIPKAKYTLTAKQMTDSHD